MFKKIIVLTVVIILVLCLTSCGNNSDDDLEGLGSFEDLDSEIELKIIKTYFGNNYKGQESVDINPIKGYCGTYNGYVVVAVAPGGWTFGMSPKLEMVGSALFVYYTNAIRVWNNDTFYTLRESYDQGFLTKADLEKIATYHEKIYPQYYAEYNVDGLEGLGNFDGLVPKIELAIIKTYFLGYYTGQEAADNNPIEVYYGTYNDCVVVCCGVLEHGAWGFGSIANEIIDGISFEYPDDSGVKVWKDDCFYSLQNAYSQSLLTKEDLEQISACMKEYHPGVYGLIPE